LTSANFCVITMYERMDDIMDLIPRGFYFDDLLDDFFPTKEDNEMKCDVYEKDGKYNIEMDIPGFDKKDVKISFDNGYLNVSAAKAEKDNEKGKNYIRRERSYRKYSRSFYVGNIDEKNINAKFNNGTLLVTLPKEQKEIDHKYISIE